MVQRSALPLSTGKNYKVVTLCGSTRFKEQYMEVQKRLTLEGCIVISVGLFGHSGDEEVWKPGTKEMLDAMHLAKIGFFGYTDNQTVFEVKLAAHSYIGLGY